MAKATIIAHATATITNPTTKIIALAPKIRGFVAKSCDRTGRNPCAAAFYAGFLPQFPKSGTTKRGRVEIETLEKRQAVLAWRDDLVLGIWHVVNRAGIEAKRGIEEHLKDAGIIDTVWDPANFTRDRVDGVMRAAVLGALEGLFKGAAEELRAIDFDYAALADALLQSLAILRFPALTATDADALPATASNTVAPSRLARLMAAVSRQELLKSAREWGSWALDMVGEASEAASQKLQSGTGLHDRLRRSAQARIDTGWMAATGVPQPIMGQLLGVVENIGSQARSMAR